MFILRCPDWSGLQADYGQVCGGRGGGGLVEGLAPWKLGTAAGVGAESLVLHQ